MLHTSSKVFHSAKYDMHNFTLHAFEQFGEVYIHSRDDIQRIQLNSLCDSDTLNDRSQML